MGTWTLGGRRREPWVSGFGIRVLGIMVSGDPGVPIGPKVVPFWGSYLEFYKVIPKRDYFGAYG